MKRTPVKKFMRKNDPTRMNTMKKNPFITEASYSGPSSTFVESTAYNITSGHPSRDATLNKVSIA